MSSPQKKETTIADAACVVLGNLSVEEFATIHGLSKQSEAADALMDLAPRAEVLAIRMQQDGRAVEQDALIALGKVVAKIGREVEAGELGPGALVRIADLLHKVSGLGARQAERIRGNQQIASGPSFSVVINIPQVITDDGKTINAVTQELKFPVWKANAPEVGGYPEGESGE